MHISFLMKKSQKNIKNHKKVVKIKILWFCENLSENIKSNKANKLWKYKKYLWKCKFFVKIKIVWILTGLKFYKILHLIKSETIAKIKFYGIFFNNFIKIKW